MKHNRIAARCLAGFISAVTVLGILTGCNSESPNSSVTEEPSSVSAISSGVEQEEGKVVLSYPDYMQELGCEDPVVLDSEPKRVVSLTRGPVLALYELGVPLIAIPSTNGDVWPEGLISQAEQLGVRGDNFNIETVIAMEPDLVILGISANRDQREQFGPALEAAGIPVYYVNAGSEMTYDDMKAEAETIIENFGNGSETGQEIMDSFAALEERLADAQERYAGKTVMVMWATPPTYDIQSENGTLGSLAAMLGFTNVFESNLDQVTLDFEEALSYNPDLILSCGRSDDPAEHEQIMKEGFAENPEFWNSIPAIQNGDIIYLSSKYITNHGIIIVDYMNELLDIIDAHYAEKE